MHGSSYTYPRRASYCKEKLCVTKKQQKRSGFTDTLSLKGLKIQQNSVRKVQKGFPTLFRTVTETIIC